jgi:two-component system response regulator DevR
VIRGWQGREPAGARRCGRSSYDDDALFAANMAGSAGYVLKQIHGTDQVDGIRRVAADQSPLDPAVVARVLQRLRDGVGPPDELAALTGRSGRS